ncbi:hypothetical protein [Paenibacillus sp.]|jgi:hypothetical protein|uniref:hypothetical protein n=1 Tax=Paenibacillus sp. TaxID=58172 RepID=UPI00281E5A8F|nr:hypothetical protein [Paenibacillus sp.]MDR0268731.1 hypothetical protein [Paenibacillus sp.]
MSNTSYPFKENSKENSNVMKVQGGEQKVMKKILTVALSTAMAFSMFASVAFGDSATVTTQQKFDALAAKGIFNGFPDKQAHLEREMTRAEFAKVLTKVMGLKEVTGGTPSYKDEGYSEKMWAYGYIEAATAAGLMKGQDEVKQIFSFNGQVTVQELATVLTRALKLEEPKEVDNTASDWAKKDVQAAINAGVISKDLNFQANATRAQLVDATYEVDQVINTTVASYTVADNGKDVEFKLSTGEVVKVTLETVLEPNKETEVKFKNAAGREITAKITWVLEYANKVDSAASTNLKEVEVSFNGKVDKATATDKDNYSIDGGNKVIKSVVLLEGDKTARILIESQFVQQQEYKVSVKNVKAGNNVISATDVKFSPVDNVLPEVKEVKSLGNKAIKVTFNKPVKTVSSSNFQLDGAPYYGSVVKGANEREVVLKSFNGTIALGAHKLTAGLVEDYVPLKSLSASYDFTVVEDKEGPAVAEVTSTLEKTKVIFNKDIDPDSVKPESFYWLSGTTKKTGVITQISGTEFEIDFNAKGNRLPGYETTLYVDVADYSGNVNPVKEHKITASVDLVRPKVVEVVPGKTKNFVQVKFDKALDTKSATDRTKYVVKKGDDVISVKDVSEAAGSNGKVWNVNFYNDLGEGSYTINISGIKDATALGNIVVDYSTTFSMSDVGAPALDGFVDANNYNRTIAISFDKKMDLQTLSSRGSYFIEFDNGAGLSKISLPNDVRIEPATNAKSVLLIFPEYIGNTRVTFATAGSVGSVKLVSATGLKSANGVPMADYVTAPQEVRQANANMTSVKRDGFKKLIVEFDKAIGSANRSDFIVNDGAVRVDSISVDGTKVTLNTVDSLDAIANTNVRLATSNSVVTLTGNTAQGTQNSTDAVAPRVTNDKDVKLKLVDSVVRLTFSKALKTDADLVLKYGNDLEIRDYKNDPVAKTAYTTAVSGSDLVITFNNKDYANDYSIKVVDSPSYIQDANGKLAVKSEKYVTEFNSFAKPELAVTTPSLKATTKEITGKAAGGSKVTATDNGVVIATVDADTTTGAFTLNVDGKLVEGHTVSIAATKNGVSSEVKTMKVEAAAVKAVFTGFKLDAGTITIHVSKGLKLTDTAAVPGLSVVGAPAPKTEYKLATNEIVITEANAGDFTANSVVEYDAKTGNIVDVDDIAVEGFLNKVQ